LKRVAVNQDEKIPKTIVVHCNTLLEDINKIFHTDIESKTQKTIAGLMEEKLQRIPKKGDEITMNSALSAEVILATESEVKDVRIRYDK
jgi:CBS domain containing-hemolysin-like protein